MSLTALFCIVVASVAVAALCRRRGWNAPLIVLAVALAASWIPGVGHIEVEPEILLGVVLPPLLYSSALSSSYQDMRASFRPIANLGVGLVLVSALAVGLLAWWLLPGLPFAAAMVLGAVVAPPDAVAAASVAKKLGLPRRITTVLTGESLINDATSLTLYKVALAGVFATGAGAGPALGTFALAVVGGVGVGLVIGWVAHRVRRAASDAVVETVVGLLVPFAAYWLAEAVHGSGVLGVVAAGLLLGRLSPRGSYSTRLYEEPLWSSIDLVLECFTFALIGLQLPWVVREVVVSPEGTWRAIWVALAVLGVALAVRPAYVFATRFLDSITLPWEGGESTRKVKLGTRDLVIVSWAGMRGVVTLAAAAAIPAFVAGRAFPNRASLQLAAYAVAIGTLLIQGLSLPALIRRLGVDNTDEAAEDVAEEKRVRELTDQVAARMLKEAAKSWSPGMGAGTARTAVEQVAEGLARRSRAAETLLALTRRPGPGAPDAPPTAEDASPNHTTADAAAPNHTTAGSRLEAVTAAGTGTEGPASDMPASDRAVPATAESEQPGAEHTGPVPMTPPDIDGDGVPATSESTPGASSSSLGPAMSQGGPAVPGPWAAWSAHGAGPVPWETAPGPWAAGPGHDVEDWRQVVARWWAGFEDASALAASSTNPDGPSSERGGLGAGMPPGGPPTPFPGALTPFAGPPASAALAGPLPSKPFMGPAVAAHLMDPAALEGLRDTVVGWWCQAVGAPPPDPEALEGLRHAVAGWWSDTMAAPDSGGQIDPSTRDGSPTPVGSSAPIGPWARDGSWPQGGLPPEGSGFPGREPRAGSTAEPPADPVPGGQEVASPDDAAVHRVERDAHKAALRAQHLQARARQARVEADSQGVEADARLAELEHHRAEAHRADPTESRDRSEVHRAQVEAGKAALEARRTDVEARRAEQEARRAQALARMEAQRARAHRAGAHASDAGRPGQGVDRPAMRDAMRQGFFSRLAHGKVDPAVYADVSRRKNELRRDIVQAQREVIVRERDAGRLNETVMRLMLRELDLEEESLASSWTNRL